MLVSAIVPARNEEKTVGEVLKVLKSSPLINEVILVNDGSIDSTGKIGEEIGVKVLNRGLEAGKGKGEAMEAAVKIAAGDIILFADADLIGLKEEHIRALIEPVRQEKAIMAIGEREGTKFGMWWAMNIGPWIGGERAMPKEFWQSVPKEFKRRFMIETALNYFARKQGGKVMAIPLRGVKQRRKEEKMGFWKGFVQRMKMSWQVAWAHFILYSGLK